MQKRRRQREEEGPALGPEERARIEAIARGAAEGAGLEVVRAAASPQRRLRVMVDRPDFAITIGDCESASRAVADALRTAGLDPGRFEIEIESPGADRPLTRPEDFERFRGAQVTVTLRVARDGRRNFTGPLLGWAGGDVTVHVLDEKAPETFLAAEIREVRLHPPIERPGERTRRRP
jgi:ribosome maturation factor RimP